MITRKVLLSAAAAVAVTASTVVFATAANADKGEVIRVIDGDTLVVDFDDQELTVRLLNVDTPETKDPDKPVECLGPEATAFLKQALPPGSKVKLEFDVEREDRYGRTLAAVYDGENRLINAEIARRGLGVPVTYGENRKFRPAVDAAYADAEANGAGFFGAETECTVPAMVAALEEAAVQAAAEETGTTAASAATAAAAALALVKVVDEAYDAVEKGARAGKGMIWTALSEAEHMALMTRAAAARDGVHARHDSLTALQAERKAAEDEAARVAAEAKAEEERKAAQAEADRIAAEQAEAARVAAAEAEAAAAAHAAAHAAAQAEANRQAQQQQQYAPPPPAQDSNPYPGYTGPRCYAPGGKTWRPC
ncbi:Thermonuclease precursor [Arthrobacter saudimassiliensis]|uniref:Thermonuclease n=1 Tax=Arthrobacter saudimassiliensis TaxID=1461584 RepID=A0A078MW94_9MICC|nr:Thermonuclease precursor [Arthrobacter saudimassiliensis]